MEKSFKLPKKFATQWLEALRSGDYTQAEGVLIENIVKKDDGMTTYKDKHCCCLGVAAVMLGATNSELGSLGMPCQLNKKVLSRINYPKELTETNVPTVKGENLVNLPIILVQLNDGISLLEMENFKKIYPNILFHIQPDDSKLDEDEEENISSVNYSFEEISQWIENNVEFYTEESNGK